MPLRFICNTPQRSEAGPGNGDGGVGQKGNGNNRERCEVAKRRAKAGVMIINPFGVLAGQSDGTNPLADQFLGEKGETESITSTIEAGKRSSVVIDPKGEPAAISRKKGR